MIARLAAVTLALALVGGALTACQPEPEPSPSASGFATEAEAFAAAEETYRAYVDALNQVDLSNPETFEPVYAWTTGEANANERKSLSQMHADGWTVSGSTVIDSFHGDTADLDSPVGVHGTVCSDVSGIGVSDASGQSMVSADRPDVYALNVVFTESSATSTGLQIQSSNAIADGPCT